MSIPEENEFQQICQYLAKIEPDSKRKKSNKQSMSLYKEVMGLQKEITELWNAYLAGDLQDMSKIADQTHEMQDKVAHLRAHLHTLADNPLAGSEPKIAKLLFGHAVGNQSDVDSIPFQLADFATASQLQVKMLQEERDLAEARLSSLRTEQELSNEEMTIKEQLIKRGDIDATNIAGEIRGLQQLPIKNGTRELWFKRILEAEYEFRPIRLAKEGLSREELEALSKSNDQPIHIYQSDIPKTAANKLAPSIVINASSSNNPPLRLYYSTIEERYEQLQKKE